MDATKPLHQGKALKRGKIRESHLEKLDLNLPLGVVDDNIKVAFHDLVSPNNPAQQIGAVEKLLSSASASEENAKVVTEILVLSLLQLQVKSQLRIKISKFISTIASRYPEAYEDTLLRVICSSLSNLGDPQRIVQAVNLVIEDGLSLTSPRYEKTEEEECDGDRKSDFKSFWTKIHPCLLKGILSGITQQWCRHTEEISSVETAELFQELQHLMKNSASYLQQFGEENPTENSSQYTMIMDRAVLILGHPSCPLDLRINCGQLAAIIYKLTSKYGLQNLVQDVVSENGQYTSLSLLAQLAIINGILCVSQGTELYSNSKDRMSLGIQVLEVILSPVFQSNDGSMAISTIRMLHHWTLRTLEAAKSPISCDTNDHLHPSSQLMSSLLDYMWLLWDHYLDSVKHATKESFQNLLKIHVELFPEDSKKHYTHICETLISPPFSRKYKLSAVSCMVNVIGCHTLLRHEPQLPEFLLNLMKDSSMASHAAELLEALFSVHAKEVSQVEWQDVWLSPFLESFCQEMQTFGYELLLKKLLLTCPESLDVVVETLTKSADKLKSEKLCLLIMCIKIGRQSTYWQRKCQEKNADKCTTMWKFIIPYETVSLCLEHIDESVQMAALSLLCESPKSTEIPEKREMDMLLDFYYYNAINQNPSYRQHLIKSTKRLFLRIKESLRILLKLKGKLDECQTKSLAELSKFCKNLLNLMMENLHVGANVARRTTSLLVLELFSDIIFPEYGIYIGIHELCCNQPYIDTLLYILDDSYESNKVIALKLLLVVSPKSIESHNVTKIQCLVDTAEQLASSCRPPDTVTASYMLKYLLENPLASDVVMGKSSMGVQPKNSIEVFLKYLLDLLKCELKVAQHSLLKAAACGPMYGLLLCLRTLLSSIPKVLLEECHGTLKLVIEELLVICQEISHLVASVVRNSSPEGHLPMDLDLESLGNLKLVLQASLGNQQSGSDIPLSLNSKPDELVKAQAVSAQMLLLCAWRSVKEISLIFGDVLKHFPLYPHPMSVLSIEDVIMIGKYFLTQLSETKHRGAFEQSYVAFCRICEQLWQCNEDQLRSLPEEWLREVLVAIQNDKDDRLCATRRSAGVPFIVQAILSSEPSIRGGTSFMMTMNTLLKLASEEEYEGSDARIHSFNILRALYRDTRLGDLIVPYAPLGVRAAIKGYKSDSWAERNSASLLFSSLVTRIFGVKKTQDDLSRKNAMSALVFFRRYPELYDFLKVELEAGALGVREGKLVPALFPLLLLLARLAPSPVEGRSSTLSVTSFTSSVVHCTSSSVLQLRSLASHALIPLVSPDNVCDVISLTSSKASLKNQNSLHGALLCLLKLIGYFHENLIETDKSDSAIQSILSLSWSATESNLCLLTRCCALELFTLLIAKRLTSVNLPVFSEIYSSSLLLLTSPSSTRVYKPWSSLCLRSAADYVLNFTQATSADISELSCSLLDNSDYEVRLLCLNYLKNVDDMPLPVFSKLLDRVQRKELHAECLVMSIHILNESVSSVKIRELNINIENWTSLLSFCMEKLSMKSCLELSTELIRLCSSVMLLLLSKFETIQPENVFPGWLEVMISFSGSENDVDVRFQVATGVSSVLAYFSHQSISDKAKLDVYEVLVTFLQDDSHEIRNVAAMNIGKFVDHDSFQSTQQPSRVVETVCDVIGGMKSPEALSRLVKLILKEDSQEGFGLTQEDDRVFDKGEMNSYREVIVVALASAKSLENALSSWPDSGDAPFLQQEIIPHLNSELNIPQGENQYLLTGTLLKLLAEDIQYIYSQISSLESKAIFSVKNVEVWLMKLACRSLLWKVLKAHCKAETDLVKTVFSGLKKSPIKGLFLSEIIDCLC